MSIETILAELEAEISRLQQARSLLSSIGATSHRARAATKPATKKRKRTLSTAARARIAAAQRERWARQKAKN